MGKIIIAAVVVAIIGVVAWVRKRKAARSAEGNQMLSFVALLKEPQLIEPIIIQTVARQAWNAELSIGEEPGDDGFIVGTPELPSIVISYQERMLLVNNFPMPYTEDPETAAASIVDMRLRELFKQHTSWISVDAMGDIDFNNPDEVREWYRLLGRLLSELVDDNCVAIFLPLTNQLFANIDETLDKLKSDDPLQELMEDAPVPVIQIGDDDPRMIAAVEKARDSFPEFVTAFEHQAGENFGIKAPVTRGDNTEYIWVTVTGIENEIIYGELANEPMDLGDLKIGSRVRVNVSELNDWAFFDTSGEPHGLFTVAVLQEAANQHEESNQDI